MIVRGDPIPERVNENYSDTHTYFVESIILVHAQSFDHAHKIAERKAHENEETHTNPYGQTVEVKLIEAIDCFIIGDKITNGIELYSSITPIKKRYHRASTLSKNMNTTWRMTIGTRHTCKNAAS